MGTIIYTGNTAKNEMIVYTGSTGKNEMIVYANSGYIQGDYVQYPIFNSYTGTTANKILNKLDIPVFNSYTASTVTAINNKVDVGLFNQFTGSTPQNLTKLDVSVFNNYTGSTNQALQNKVNTSTYASFTALTTQDLSQKLNVTGFNSYTASTTTKINNKLDVNIFNSYSGNTVNNLSNKVDKSNSTFRDAIDNNKQISFDLSRISSGQNRSIIWKDGLTDIGNLSTQNLVFTFKGNGGILQTGVHTGFFKISYSATIVGWTLYETSKTPINATSTIGVYKKSSFYPTSADTILSSTLTNTTNNSVSGLSILVNAGDVFAAEIAANNNAVNLTLILTLVKT